jgi:hypothetical protein
MANKTISQISQDVMSRARENVRMGIGHSLVRFSWSNNLTQKVPLFIKLSIQFLKCEI